MFLLSGRIEWTIICQSIRIVSLNTYMVFHCSSLSKLLVTFHDLKGPWRHDEGSLVAIFRFGVSSLPVIRCLRVFRMTFVQKSRLSVFSHWLIMERSQNWPDLRPPISKFRDMYLTRAGPGGVWTPPPSGFSQGTAAYTYCPHTLWKFRTQVPQGQVTRSRQVTSPQKSFECSS